VGVQFGDFAVDFGSRQLLRGRAEIHLGPKAFDLLERLPMTYRVLPPVSTRTEAGS
jgi:DNA-binding winged helix-turn-helix (wHTH) protein